jgi:hypothetical protein
MIESTGAKIFENATFEGEEEATCIIVKKKRTKKFTTRMVVKKFTTRVREWASSFESSTHKVVSHHISQTPCSIAGRWVCGSAAGAEIFLSSYDASACSLACR